MKPTVFYTLFLGIFLAGGVAAQEPRLVLPVGHKGAIVSAEFTKNGKLILTSSRDNSSKVWDANTGKLLYTMDGLTNLNFTPGFSSNDQFIFTSVADSLVKVWETKSSKLLYTLRGHSGAVKSVTLSEDQKYFYTAAADTTIRIWEAGTGKLFKTFNLGSTYTTYAAFSPDGKKLITCSRGYSYLWESNTGKLLQVLNSKHDDGIKSAVFNHNGSLVITISEGGYSALLWDLNQGKQLYNLADNGEKIYNAAFSTDGNIIVTKSLFGNVKTRITSTGALLHVYEGRTDFFSYAAISNNGKYVVSGLENDTGVIWDSTSTRPIHVLNNGKGGILRFCFSPDEKRILITHFDGTAVIYDIASGKLLNTLQSLTYPADEAIIAGEGKYLIFATADTAVKIVEAKSGILIHTIPGNYLELYEPGRTDTHKSLLAVLNNQAIQIWEISSGQMLQELRGHTNSISAVAFSSDGKKIASASYDGSIIIWETLTGKQVRMLIGHKAAVYSVAFADSNRFIISASRDRTAKVWDAQTGKINRTFQIIDNSFNTSGFEKYKTLTDTEAKFVITFFRDIVWGFSNLRIWDNQTGKQISIQDNSDTEIKEISLIPGTRLFATLSDTVKFLRINTGKQQNYLQTVKNQIYALSFNDDGKLILALCNGEIIKLADQKTGKILFEWQGHSNKINSAAFGPGSTTFVTASEDHSNKYWEINKRQLLYTMVFVGKTEYFCQLPTGYYQSTPNTSKLLHYVAKDLRLITFEQLDVKYNRPDKVLEAIGNTDTALIKSYRKAWEKRIKKLGIDTTQFREGYSVPECDFVNRDQIEAEQKTETVRLHIKANDSTYLLDRFNVWINESPLFGQRGISIRRKNSNSLDTIISIKLSQGENRIECSITNVNGTESYRMPLYVNYTPAVKQKESLRFIGIGIDRFSEKGHDLQYSVKDIRDLSAKLKEKYGNDIQIDTLFNENVNSRNVSALKTQLQQTTVNDKVILAYSGHGLLSKDYDYYLSSYTINFSKPEQNGLPYEVLENLLDSIPARRKLMLIDACHSGEVDKEEMTRISNASDSLQKQGTKGGKPTYTGKATLGMKNSFELMQSLFVNVGKSTGATVISAAAGTQFALERGDLKNGVFTYSILEAMNKYPTIKISELRKIVGERVEKLTNGLQKPTSRNETIATDWTL
ncbi:MAG: caspase family protein [Chitinophagaceae bacterium]|nr:caspase family protein [Chitinophagaceae bacterium]